MKRLRPFSPWIRRWLAVSAGVCLAAIPGLAQEALPSGLEPTNAVVTTNPPLPHLSTGSSEAKMVLPTKNERNDFILATARYQAATQDWRNAEKNYLKLLGDDVPENVRQVALFEMAQAVRFQNDLPRAQAIYAQYLQRWPGDGRTPEIFLHQGQVFREMGLPDLALAKFYGVMTTALALKTDQMGYYKGLVLQAQVEIAETHYREGKFADAVDYYSRLLTQDDPALDRAQIQFRLIRSLVAIKRYGEAVSQALDFLARYPDSLEEPEVRYHLAHAYKGQNRSTEALQQVKIFLKEEREKTTNNPAVWSYWQQRVGNEIGNELYQDGDYVKALQVYEALGQLDAAPAWQLPVRYQIGLTYERLLQPKLAIDSYRSILSNTPSLSGTNLTPTLKSVTDMAAWRLNFLEWSERAEAFNHQTVATSTSTNLTAQQP